MTLSWEFLRTHDHPTLESILQVLRALEELGGEKPESVPETNRRFEYAVDQASQMGTRENSKLQVQSFLKKVDRLDKCLGMTLGKVFRGWLDPELNPHTWRSTLDDLARDKQSLMSIVEAYQRSIRIGAAVPSPIEITVQTSRLLDVRLWPNILREFYEEVPGASTETVRVVLSTTEPYVIIDQVKDGVIEHDLMVTYCDPVKIPSNETLRIERILLHRCLLGTEGKLPGSTSTKEILKRERIAALRGAERIVSGFPWHDVADRIDYRGTTIGVHSYCRNGCGVGVSHVEFLDELEQKELELRLLPPEDYGESALVCIRQKRLAGDKSAKQDLVDILERIAHRHLKEIKGNYDRSVELTRLFGTLTSSYTTALTYLECGRKSSVRSDVWRGRVSLKVTASLFVTGRVELYGSADTDNMIARNPQSLRLFGRIRLPQSSNQGQMVLRGMSRSHGEMLMASFIVEEGIDELHAPGIKEHCMIGHWIGKDWSESISAPNGGVWILHSNPDLSLRDATQLIRKFQDRFPVGKSVESLGEMLGTMSGEAEPPAGRF